MRHDETEERVADELSELRAINADLLAALVQAKHSGEAAGIPVFMLEQISAAILRAKA